MTPPSSPYSMWVEHWCVQTDALQYMDMPWIQIDSLKENQWWKWIAVLMKLFYSIKVLCFMWISFPFRTMNMQLLMIFWVSNPAHVKICLCLFLLITFITFYLLKIKFKCLIFKEKKQVNKLCIIYKNYYDCKNMRKKYEIWK